MFLTFLSLETFHPNKRKTTDMYEEYISSHSYGPSLRSREYRQHHAIISRLTIHPTSVTHPATP